ncbi:hypothetical protein CLV92_1158 [Kineococcus xinjiangensis]|uniref:Uncharacterized protein n=1 Tax=Kineococcus xinjiangensis TaxID=512762 RepID=A0A2S6IDG5_9ACTN|nr:hypothetical protein CLV92_1158 [Kineococcus xinjiangensis]
MSAPSSSTMPVPQGTVVIVVIVDIEVADAGGDGCGRAVALLDGALWGRMTGAPLRAGRG